MSSSSTADPPQRKGQKEQLVSNAQGSGVRLNISISKSKQAERPELASKYDFRNYQLSPTHVFPEKFRALIPRNTPAYIEHGEKYVERITRALYHFKQCALIGPSGTGKTHIVYLVAELQELPLWEINCGLQTSVYDMFGRYVGLGKENWIDGQITSWCRNGGILYLDEANMMRQDVATRLNPLLDTRGHLILTEKDSEIISRGSDSYVIISLNPYSSEFAGTKPLNVAFRRRMSVWIDFDYLSVGNRVSDEEIALVEQKGHVPIEIATGIVRVGAELRRLYKSNEIPYGPSLGDLVNWAILVADGIGTDTAAEETIIAMTSDNSEIQETVRRIVQMVFGNSSSATKASAPAEIIAPPSRKETIEQVPSQTSESSAPKKKISFKSSFGIRSDSEDPN